VSRSSVARALAWVAAATFSLAGCTRGSSGPDLAAGEAHYQKYCALCHGASGQGYAADQANALFNQDFLALANDGFMRASVARGRPGTSMSAWGATRGGPLDDAAVDALVAFMRSKQTAASIDTATIAVGAGKAERGQSVYAVYCADCHGKEGQGGKYMSIANPEFLAVANNGYLRQVIAKGRSGTAMTAFDGNLTAQNTDDLVALIRSWQKPIDGTPIDLPSKNLGDPRMNPTGPDPAFPADGRFLKVADFKKAYDAMARMVLLDARPPADYVAGHIAGAVSVPFYAVQEYFSQLPKNEWIVAYCACPHAESGAAADALVANGYTKVKVLDEGLPGWKALGLSVKTGSKP
jgi:cytochrome c oxidase cbb3-type subunit 3/ubiquinol-cytochrome c reductase cytochrome c subunit